MYRNGRGPMMGGNRGFMGGPMMGGRRGPMGGPMMGGHRSYMGGPMHHAGMGFRPMHHRPMGLFPLGGLFLFPALMFGGWMVVAVLGSILGLIGSVIGGAFEGLSSLASGAFTGGGLVAGIVIGVVLYFWLKKRNAAKQETVGDADGEEATEQFAETNDYHSACM